MKGVDGSDEEDDEGAVLVDGASFKVIEGWSRAMHFAMRSPCSKPLHEGCTVSESAEAAGSCSEAVVLIPPRWIPKEGLREMLSKEIGVPSADVRVARI
jgi:hypothetical protein